MCNLKGWFGVEDLEVVWSIEVVGDTSNLVGVLDTGLEGRLQ